MIGNNGGCRKKVEKRVAQEEKLQVGLANLTVIDIHWV